MIGLNESFDGLKYQITNMESLPDVAKAYVMAIRSEQESLAKTSFGTNISEIGAVVPKVKKLAEDWKKKKKLKKYLVCEHCHATGHSKDTCFKLVGYPDWFTDMKKSGQSKKQVATMAADVSSLDSSKEAITPELSAMISQFMKQKFSKIAKGNEEYASFVTMGEFAGTTSSSSFNFESSGMWIVDMGASCHICFEEHLLHDIRILSTPVLVHLPNGMRLYAKKVGKVFITSD